MAEIGQSGAGGIGQAAHAAVARLKDAMGQHRTTISRVHEIARRMEESSARAALALAVLDSDPSEWHAFIDAWFNRHVSGSIVGRDTSIYNHVHAAKEELKRTFG